MTNLITSLIVATWLAVIAILSVQNATPVALRFLLWQSIEIPVGIVLAFSTGIGLMTAAVAQPLLSGGSSTTPDTEDETVWRAEPRSRRAPEPAWKDDDWDSPAGSRGVEEDW